LLYIVAAMENELLGLRRELDAPGASPGVPLEEMVLLPGTPVIENGYLTPSDAPGFGIEVGLDWLEARTV